MNESFESRLKRLGYYLKLAESSNEFVLKPTSAKVKTGLVLILTGLIAATQITVPIAVFNDIYSDVKLDYPPILTLIRSGVGFFGLVAIVRGLNRVLDFWGKNIKFESQVTTSVKRKDTKKKSDIIDETVDFKLKVADGNAQIVCVGANDSCCILEETGDRESIEVFEELTVKLKGRI